MAAAGEPKDKNKKNKMMFPVLQVQQDPFSGQVCNEPHLSRLYVVDLLGHQFIKQIANHPIISGAAQEYVEIAGKKIDQAEDLKASWGRDILIYALHLPPPDPKLLIWYVTLS